MIVPVNIRFAFFDFDDTLFVHFRAAELWTDADILFELQRRLEIVGQPEQNIYNHLGSVNHLLREFITEDAAGIPMFCISASNDCALVHHQSEWLNQNYPIPFSEFYSADTPEEKLRLIKRFARQNQLKPCNILLVDDDCKLIEQAVRAGIYSLSTVEVMARKCEERR